MAVKYIVSGFSLSGEEGKSVAEGFEKIAETCKNSKVDAFCYLVLKELKSMKKEKKWTN